ncbi:glycosyltransferase [Microbacterium xanthum]|uniref:glycosyltransferase n=1 Tax=Microbacterium xanthum TaxID=3079794 RepID=UPI002AD4330B|nr:glycosyltransferase [Microbacterium sp. KSW-48]MDZ8170739.1 glycosyltransferase [Microbacterium sp. KSW-48]
MDDLTVVIPAYNARETLAAAVASARRCGAEVLVVDDGSTDDSASIARDAGAIVIAQANAGAASARRNGLEHAGGKYVCFLDSDDALEHEGVGALLDWLKLRPRAVGAVGLAQYVTRGSSHIVRHWAGSIDLAALLMRAQPPAPPAAFVWSRSHLLASLDAAPPPLSPRYAEDYELAIRMAMMGAIGMVDVVACRYAVQGGKSSRSPLNSLRAAERIRRYYANAHGISIEQRGSRELLARAQLRRAFEDRVGRNFAMSVARTALAAGMDPKWAVKGLVRRFNTNRVRSTRVSASSIDDGKKVLIWRERWLQPSETFVRLHAIALTRWRAKCVGLYRIDSPLSRDDDVVLLKRLHVHSDGLISRTFQIVGWPWGLRRELKGASLIHAHFASDAMYLRSRFARRGLPFVVTLHGVDISAAPKVRGWYGAIYRGRLRKVFREASLVICVSKHIANEAIRWGADPGRVRVLFNGVEIPTEISDHRGTDIVFVGRLVEKKGVADLLRAARGLGADTTIRVVGDGPLAPELRELASKCTARVVFHGPLPAKQVHQIIANSGVVVVPSITASNGDTEGMPTVIGEAMARARPVVATRHAGIPEVLEDGVSGILVGESDLDALTHALRTLLADEGLRVRMGSSGRTFATEHLNAHRQARKLERLYDQIVGVD